MAVARYLGDGGVPAEEGPPSGVVALHPPRPNPVRGWATVAFDLPGPAGVRLALYDALGREVAVLADRSERSAGRHEAALDASGLAPGVYVLRLEAGGGVVVRRVSVVR